MLLHTLFMLHTLCCTLLKHYDLTLFYHKQWSEQWSEVNQRKLPQEKRSANANKYCNFWDVLTLAKGKA
jgi:hypothetical protein